MFQQYRREVELTSISTTGLFSWFYYSWLYLILCCKSQYNNKNVFYLIGFEGEQSAEPRAANRGERPTFNHYSSKPQLYNANIPFHMHGLGMYPPPPPPPPPNPNPTNAGQYPFYQQQQQQQHPSQYPYWMMHQN